MSNIYFMSKKPFEFRWKRPKEKDPRLEDDDSLPEYDGSLSRLSGFLTKSRSRTNATALTSSSDSQALEEQNKDPMGLNVVFWPPEERIADIIFVHGLGGSSRMTWSKNRDLNNFWPLEFLSKESGLIRRTRILTFGYNSNFRPGAGKSQMSILDFAKELLFDLKYGQGNCGTELKDLGMGQKPIVFVTHSMGGLVFKEAYLQGQNDPNYDDIIKSITAVLFLSTPHRGTNLAETLNRILQVSFVTNPMKFIAELAAGSQTLQRLNEQFRHVASNLQVMSFYETRPTPVLRKTQVMVLEKDSSMLGYPGEVSKPLDADHHGVCKFDSPSDPRYITVRNALLSVISKSEGKMPTKGLFLDARRRSQSVDRNLVRPTSNLSIKNYLSVPESPEVDYNFFRDRWTPGTCQWILQEEAFNSWIKDTSQKSRVLWVHGNPASGKSVLSSFVIDRLVQLGVVSCYFFVRFADQHKTRLSMMLRSLANQLADKIPSYAENLRHLESTTPDLKTADSRSVWQWLFKQALFRLNVGEPIYFVIDGIDEADSPGTAVKFLSDLNLTSVALRILLVSRKTYEITSAFQKIVTQVHTDTISTGTNTHDLRAHIKHEMDIASDQAEYRDQVITQLLERAKGNFLWIHLGVQRINGCHTKADVERALDDLPAGMEALYDRMAASIQSQTNAGDRHLGLNILGWALCARRALSVEELSDALDNSGLLDMHRSIRDLCGGFVVVDAEGHVAMIHETAREYLIKECDGQSDHSLTIQKKSTNDKLLLRCIRCLTQPTLKARIAKGHPPGLLDYAATSWYHHFALGSYSNTEISSTVMRFLQGPQFLIWVQLAARKKELRTLVLASSYLADIGQNLRKLQADTQTVDIFEGVATDLVKIVGKFGQNLTRNPDSIFRLIPPLCPKDSIIYKQFGRREERALSVSGSMTNSWDDCLARFSFDSGAQVSVIIHVGNTIAVLANGKRSSQIIIHDAVTFEEQKRFTHPERVISIEANKLGSLVLSYGYLTTRVWDLATGDCVKIVKNPQKRPRPHTIVFVDEDETILVGHEDMCLRSFSLSSTNDWELRGKIEEEATGVTMINLPMCSAISPDGTMIAFGYRGHPLTVWEIEPQMLVGQCKMTLDAADMTIQTSTWLNEVFGLAWHPFNGELYGFTQVGTLFKWEPLYRDEASLKALHAGANRLAVSGDGSLLVTGDGPGSLKIFKSSDLTLLYHLSSQDPVLYVSFSMDSRRIYDSRGAYGNVWEPNILARLAEKSHERDMESEGAMLSTQAEHRAFTVDKVIALAGQPVGSLYCYGTEDGVAVLGEVGKGKVGEIERLSSFMSIEQLAWSEDGLHVAVSDLNGRVSIKKISRSSHDREAWEIKHEFQVVIPTHESQICQLLFDPSGGQLLATTDAALHKIDLGSRSLVQSVQYDGSGAKWMSHSTLPEYLIAFKNFSAHLVRWKDLTEVESYNYRSPETTEGSTVRIENGTTIKKMVYSMDWQYVLLKMVSFPISASGKPDTQYMLFDISDLRPDPMAQGTEAVWKELAYSVLPSRMASRIREPLGFLSQRRLLFLDAARWICTWRLPYEILPDRSTTTTGKESQVLENEAISVGEEHYFLPNDWATADEAKLCSAMPDGTLLCPRNGNVMTVQCAKLRI
ncbi:hypothetical protein QBC38DRAFT_517229 [Podospora fimiseda]|uniref:GPI inositol-deacylase n=1 Tax=Podospora fimiseda TaxID=252190 RepID=A0AAN7BHA1_9PEZI|nr:hypothetical protein QBC38DRAFT_517229 [Podospora fimiseda]